MLFVAGSLGQKPPPGWDGNRLSRIFTPDIYTANTKQAIVMLWQEEFHNIPTLGENSDTIRE